MRLGPSDTVGIREVPSTIMSLPIASTPIVENTRI